MFLKIQAIYFKIQVTYFKISALYFSAFQTTDNQHPKKHVRKPLKRSPDAPLFSCLGKRFSALQCHRFYSVLTCRKFKHIASAVGIERKLLVVSVNTVF